jgi:alpha-glucosidase (family GH31 glycosyl hydrolase)
MKRFFLLSIIIAGAFTSVAQNKLGYSRSGRSVIFSNDQGHRLRITPYGNYIIRIQAVRKNEAFFTDDHYEMVETHQWPGSIAVTEDKSSFTLSPQKGSGIIVSVDRIQLKLSFAQTGSKHFFLKQNKAVEWDAGTVTTSFVHDNTEHFTGLGHSYLGRADNIDLQGQLIERNYGTEHGQQAPLIVPFYLSNKGYGVFVNSTFPNSFSFGKDNNYEFSLQGDARMDFFVILGPQFSSIIDRYTQLTGRPRFPLKAFFGLALSDKGHDHTSATPSNENWWKEKITQHRNAGFPLDHIVNDNRWRAGGGQRCVSYFDWDGTRYPDPKEYQQWVRQNGLITTLDFNRCIAVQSEGWKPSFNLPKNEGIDFNTSAPDFTKKEVRDWFWNTMWKKSLNPALHFPGDALWIDEFDEMGKAPLSMKFENGTTWEEMRNYWFFLISKSLVQQGWDKSFKGSKRPFVWVRGMTAGAQRYATLWSGDIRPTYDEMKQQVRGMQLAGLSAFPFWGHDAGGFHKEPDDTLFSQWAMAVGSFSPFWKPHGIGKSRWPLDRSDKVQKIAHLYSELRYKLMPYTYTTAYQAYEKGLPMARAMLIGNQNNPLAWKYDLQYMWGDALLVAPNCSAGNDVKLWLPGGWWYDFWNDEKLEGSKEIDYPSPVGKLPLFVKSGSIIPMAGYALSTAFIHADSLTIHVYTGDNGKFVLYEDDGISEAYRKNEKRTTAFAFNQSTFSLIIDAAKGTYKNAPDERTYEIIFHGLSKPVCIEVNGMEAKTTKWDAESKTLSLRISKKSVMKRLLIRQKAGCFKQG